MITLHHLEKSRSHRVAWLLEELGVDYEVKVYARDPQTSLAPAELAAVHPLGKAPVVVDGDITIAETGAIVDYLIATYGDGRFTTAPGTEARRRDVYWSHYSEGSAMPLLLMRLVFGRIATRKGPPVVGAIVRKVGKNALDLLVTPHIPRHLDHWNRELEGRTWFAGGEEPTSADFMMSFPVEAAAARVGVDDRPNLKAFLERVHARPAYQRASERVGPLTMLGG